MSLDDIEIKLRRAEEHLEALNDEFDRFATAQPRALHVVTNQRGNEILDVVWVRKPPRRWGAIIGDCVHNMRSALDHMVWQLSGGGGIAPAHAEFPIFVDEVKYYERTNQGKPRRGSGLSKIEGIESNDVRALIEGLQPFHAHDPTRHPLWVIHDLDRFDKHRALHPVGGWAFTHNRLGHRVRSTADLEPGWRRAMATSSHERPAPTPAGRKTRVKVRSDLALFITLEAPMARAQEHVDVLLAELLEFVRLDVLRELAPWLQR